MRFKSKKARTLEPLDDMARQITMILAGAFQMDDNPKQWFGACQKCGENKFLQWAHIMSRGIHATRWDEQNALALCGGCHYAFAHHRPLEFTEWVKERMGEVDYYALIGRSRCAIDYSETKLSLTKRLKQLRGGEIRNQPEPGSLPDTRPEPTATDYTEGT